MSEEHKSIEWREGDNCPHCEAEEETEFYESTDNYGDLVRHDYVCSECEKVWYIETEFKAWKVIK